MIENIKASLNEASKVLNLFLENPENIDLINGSIDSLTLSAKENLPIISCGNGGSMCDSMHFAEELTGRYRKNRAAVAATAIADPSHLSCVANDFGYEFVFSRYIEAWGRANGTLLAISTSGNSENIINATLEAKKKGMKVIGLLGKDGGKLKDLVDFPLIVPSNTTDRIQEIHIKLIHIFIEGIERNLFPQNY